MASSMEAWPLAVATVATEWSEQQRQLLCANAWMMQAWMMQDPAPLRAHAYGGEPAYVDPTFSAPPDGCADPQKPTTLTSSASRRRRRRRAAEYASLKQSAWAAEEAASDNAADVSGDGGADEEVASLQGCVWQMSLDARGSRRVQQAIAAASDREGERLAAELHGHVLDAVYSPHANYVIQRVISDLPRPVAEFVVEELRGKGAELSRHRFGCRIMCRLLEHASDAPITSELVDEALTDVSDLSRARFGHHVVQSILEYGLPQQRQQVASALRGRLLSWARHPNMSLVIVKALTHCDEEVQKAIASELAGDANCVAVLTRRPFSRLVLQAALAKSHEESRRMREMVEVYISGLPETSKRWMEKELGLAATVAAAA